MLKKLASFINSEFDKIYLDEIIFVNFINKEHYQFLTPNKNFIKNRLNKNTPTTHLIIINVIINKKKNTWKWNHKILNNLPKENKVKKAKKEERNL